MADSNNKMSFSSTGEEGISLSMEVSASDKDDALRVRITSTTTTTPTMTSTTKHLLLVEVTCPYNPQSMVATIHGGEVFHFIDQIKNPIQCSIFYFENQIVITGEAPLMLHELYGDVFGFPGWVF